MAFGHICAARNVAFKNGNTSSEFANRVKTTKTFIDTCLLSKEEVSEINSTNAGSVFRTQDSIYQ